MILAAEDTQKVDEEKATGTEILRPVNKSDLFRSILDKYTHAEKLIMAAAHNEWLAGQVRSTKRIWNTTDTVIHDEDGNTLEPKPGLLPFGALTFLSLNFDKLEESPYEFLLEFEGVLNREFELAVQENPGIEELRKDRYKVIDELKEMFIANPPEAKVKLGKLVEEAIPRIEDNSNWLQTSEQFVQEFQSQENNDSDDTLAEKASKLNKDLVILSEVKNQPKFTGFKNKLQALFGAPSALEFMAIAHINWRRGKKFNANGVVTGNLSSLKLDNFNENISDLEVKKMLNNFNFILSDYNSTNYQIGKAIDNIRETAHKSDMTGEETFLLMFEIIQRLDKQIESVPENGNRYITLTRAAQKMLDAILLDFSVSVFRQVIKQVDPEESAAEQI